MKYRDPLIVLITALLIGSGSMAKAANSDETAQAAERAAVEAQQAQLEAEHHKALAEAERQQQEAEATLERARVPLPMTNTCQKMKPSVFIADRFFLCLHSR